MKKFCIIAVIIATIGIGAYKAQKLDTPIHLSIPSCDITVDCEYVQSPTSERVQSIVDKQGVAAWYDCYILDHAGQNFNGLWDIAVGDEVIFGDVLYHCAFITTGWSDRGIYPTYGEMPDADLYLCTCMPYGHPYEIYIVGINR